MEQQKSPSKWWALIGLSLLSFTAFIDFTIVSTALPFIQKSLQVSILQLQWVTNSYSLALCMFSIVVGRFGDLLGRRRVFYFGFLVFGISILGAGYAHSIQWLIFFRAIQGFAAAIIFTLGASLLPEVFPATEQARAMSIFSAFNGAGLAIGPFLGGVLISMFTWRSVFFVNIPIIMFGLAFCLIGLKPMPSPHVKVKIDWIGLFLLIIGLGSLVLGIINGEQAGWDSYATWLLICLGVISLTLLIHIEKRIDYSLLDTTIFKNLKVCLAMLICITAGVVTFVLMFFDPLYLRYIKQQTPFFVGLILLAVPLVQVIISLFFETLSKRFTINGLLIFGIITALFSAICQAFFTTTTNMLFIIITLIPMGYTWGIANVGTIAAISQSVAKAKIGGALGTVFTFWNMTGSISLALATVIFHWREKITLDRMLLEVKMPLSFQQKKELSLMLSDPSQEYVVHNYFAHKQSAVIYHSFQSSFMNGFRYMAVFIAIFLFIILLTGWRLKLKND